MENINFCYPGQRKDQLMGVTIKMNLSSRVALLGANGAGKTGLILNEWLEKHQKHNYNSIINQDILHNIYHYNIVSHVFEVDELTHFLPK
jgi:ABC-type bacteriocin/lantibiotic exporter with double-glycine peptidase domain